MSKTSDSALEVDRLSPQQTIARLALEVRSLREENAKLQEMLTHSNLSLRVQGGEGCVFQMPNGDEYLVFREEDQQEDSWRYSFAPLSRAISTPSL